MSGARSAMQAGLQGPLILALGTHQLRERAFRQDDININATYDGLLSANRPCGRRLVAPSNKDANRWRLADVQRSVDRRPSTTMISRGSARARLKRGVRQSGARHYERDDYCGVKHGANHPLLKASYATAVVPIPPCRCST